MIQIDGYDLVVVESDFVTCDILVWRYYRNRVPGVVEALLDTNPHLAKVHKFTPFIPAGIHVRMPVNNNALLSGKPQKQEKTIWWERSSQPAGPSSTTV